MTSVHITILAKAPRAGFAKTRLIPALGADGAADLAYRLLDHAVAQAHAARIGPVELCVTPASDAMWRQMRLPPDTQISDQGEGDLGERLARACERVTSAGGPVLLMGTDCPALDAERLSAIATQLAGHDAVLVPATDGGYAALALQRFDASLFSNIAWSTSSVGATTLSRLQVLGWRVAVLPALSDIDEPSDLAALPAGWMEVHHG